MIGKVDDLSGFHYLANWIFTLLSGFFVDDVKNFRQWFAHGFFVFPAGEFFCNGVDENNISFYICSNNTITDTAQCYCQSFLFFGKCFLDSSQVDCSFFYSDLKEVSGFKNM